MLRRLAHAASTKHQYAKSGFGFEASRQLWPGSSRPVMRRTVNGELTNAAQRCDSLDLPADHRPVTGEDADAG